MTQEVKQHLRGIYQGFREYASVTCGFPINALLYIKITLHITVVLTATQHGSMELAKQKLGWKLERKEGANFSKPERIGYTQEFGLLGSLFRSIDMAGKETGGVESRRRSENSKRKQRSVQL